MLAIRGQRRYDLVWSEPTMRQRLQRQQIRNVGLSTKPAGGLDKDSNIYSELKVVKSPRAPLYEIQYVKTKKDGIKQVPVLRSQANKPAGRGGDKETTKSKKTDEDQPEVDETGSIVSDKSGDNKDDMVGLRVIACNKRDGMYYPGTVANHLETTYAVVHFNFNKRQKVRTHMIIPMSGAIPRPELAAGDFVLVKVLKDPLCLDFYVPGIIEVVAKDIRTGNKFYSVVLYNGQRDTTMRKFIVKIGRDRFEMTVKYIAHVQSLERSKSALSDTSPRSQDTHLSKTTTDGSERSERSSRSEDEQSDRSSIRSSNRSSLRSGSKKGRKKKEKVTKKLAQKHRDERHGKSRSKLRSLSRSRSRSRSDSGRLYSRSSNNTQTSLTRRRKQHSRLRRRSESRSSSSRSRSRPSSRSHSSRSPSRSRSEMSNDSWSKFRSQNRRRSRSSSGSSTVKSRSRSPSKESPDRTPTASPFERPESPVPKPRPEEIENPTETTPAASTADAQEKPNNDEKDKVIGDLQYLLGKQDRLQIRQEWRLIRQARKINKIERKLRHSDKNSSINSEKGNKVGDHPSNTDGSPGQRNNTKETKMSVTVQGLDYNSEVLARWSDDGWYYRGRVSQTNESGCVVEDSMGHEEEILYEDIFSEDGSRCDAFQPQDFVIALHPKYVFSYAPGEILRVFDNGNVKVEFYDGSVSKLTPDEVYKVSKDKYKKDVKYIKRKERGLVGESVVARDDQTGAFRRGVVDSRIGDGQQYCLKWLDGGECKQTSIHIFERPPRRSNRETLEYVLAPVDSQCLKYEPAVVLQHTPPYLQLKFLDISSNSEASQEQCFKINKEYYTNAVDFLQSRKGALQP